MSFVDPFDLWLKKLTNGNDGGGENKMRRYLSSSDALRALFDRFR
jgi:hypothetical protein